MTMERTRARDAGPRNYIGIVVSGARYAIDVRRVREIVRPSAIAPLPEGAVGLVGVAYHRGEVVPVVDLRTRLAARADPKLDAVVPAARDRSRWVLARMRDARLAALIVDEVEGVYASSPREAQAPSPVAGVHLRAGALVLELDVDALTAPAAGLALPGVEGPSA